jgi:hypothetical protein
VSEAERLRAAFEDPARWISDVHAARAAALLRAHVVERIDAAVGAVGVKALVVKGEALARSAYPAPWMRPMGDIDLLVLDRDRAAVERALAAAGFAPDPPPAGRPLSGRFFDETNFALRVGPGAFAVEVHGSLDKLTPRPMPLSELLARARPLSGSLLAPAPEDHLLLVAVHAAVSDLAHPIAFLDLERLLRGGIDGSTLAERAARYRAATAVFVALATLRALGSTSVPDALLARLAPGPVRRRAIDVFYRVGRYPAHAPEPELGWRWALRQATLRDDTARWLGAVARYGAARLAEELWARSPLTSSQTAGSASKPRG